MSDSNPKKQVSIIARQAIKKHSTMEDQKKYIHNKVFKNSQLVKDLALLSLNNLSNGYLYGARNDMKSKLNQSCVDTSRKYPNESKRTPEVIGEVVSLLDTYFCGSKPIGKCTGAEILAQSVWHRKNGIGHIEQADIFLNVSKQVPSKKLAEKCINEKKLISIINKEKTKKKAI